eukprot:CAMPEP_0181334872 /NCGR_PEP_ID=MMETSP1101-20121128/26513_1 /TAXON_ID=46948 /ORGANISM="Rhodomonas abbreviata, Strain Caron Lab Isolate" /LENGTH=90 /DNA_ID=CAMNT_0023444921 /DNA_START=46 /DNA_END=315 /DNA_ORIENTATION=-
MNTTTNDLYLPPAVPQTGAVASAYSEQAQAILQILSSMPQDKRGPMLMDLLAQTDTVDLCSPPSTPRAEVIGVADDNDNLVDDESDEDIP